MFYDFCYYWHHRLGHTCALFWAAHVVHHQSEDYNLSTALRQASSGALAGWLLYLPMALASVPPLVFAVLILWDRLFGSFQKEDDRDPCVYGTRSLLRRWDPIWAHAEVYASLWQSSWCPRRWSDILRVWLMPPGWQPPDLTLAHPQTPFDLQRVQIFTPQLIPGVVRFAVVQFALLLAVAGVYLWLTDGWPLWQSGVWFVVLLAINKFVTPLPHSPVWVLSRYHTAQCLIVMGWLLSR